MSIWISKKIPERSIEEKDSELTKKKEKIHQTKRIDNLRIPQQLKINLKSLGTHTSHTFLTKDLSATGVFVMCKDATQYPFQPQSTILQATVEGVNGDDNFQLQFLGKIARVVSEPNGAQPSGFGLRIIQISFEHRQMLETFIARHGSPENPAKDEVQHVS